jgi:DNA mismatch repair protein MutS2
MATRYSHRTARRRIETDVIDESVLQKLEYTEVLRRLSVHCQYSVAADLARELRPSPDRRVATMWMDTTAEAMALLRNFPEFTVGGAKDIRELVLRAEKGARLQPPELLLIADTLHAARRLKKMFLRLPEHEERFPNLLEIVGGIENVHKLETGLEQSIGPRGDVLDTASSELARLRKAVRTAHSRVTERLRNLQASGRVGAAMQENIITVREGRYVIPVRAEARNVVRGIVHGTSQSGQTLFIEPYDVVELNNSWRERQLEEEEEVNRILDDLSAQIAEQADVLRRMVHAIAEIDLALAKARYATTLDASRPSFHDTATGGRRVHTEDTGHPSHVIRLIDARHPLLDQSTVVPLSLEMGETFRVLLITGPNTGGKTVALKTVGLLTLMAQSGLFIPASDASVISVFPQVFVDIGDEQSIEQSLSTFSAHMSNIVRMLRQARSDSLVLLDELGAGTDPQEGSALARALISRLLQLRSMVIATTHYSEVKAYAYATPGVENASVEFDVETLSPTYRLTVGIPGKSNALAIARRLGVPGEVIEEARGILHAGDQQADDLINDIRRRREQAREELTAAERTRADVEELRRRAARALREAEQTRRDARDHATAEVEQELQEARELARRLQRTPHGVAAPTRDEAREASTKIAAALDETRRIRRKRQPQPQQVQHRRPIRAGDRVRVHSLDMTGDVLSVDGDNVSVQLGALKTRVPVTDVERTAGGAADESGSKRASADRYETPKPSMNISVETDLRGMRAAEVEQELEQYLHDAWLAGLPWVRIIHGKGTGALRNVVRNVLQDHPVVERSETAKQNEGGDGATVAYLRGNA